MTADPKSEWPGTLQIVCQKGDRVAIGISPDCRAMRIFINGDCVFRIVNLPTNTIYSQVAMTLFKQEIEETGS